MIIGKIEKGEKTIKTETLISIVLIVDKKVPGGIKVIRKIF